MKVDAVHGSMIMAGLVRDTKNILLRPDFTKPENYGYGKLESDGASVDIVKGGVINSGIVTITNVNPGTTSNNVQQHSTETSSNGTLNLGYATWKGGIKGGKPHGKGTMTFTKSHSIDGCQEQALPGDYIIGYCEDGILTNGALYRDGEKVESFIR